jgi:hypothetical protein
MIDRYSRREFLGVAAAGAAASFVPSWMPRGAARELGAANPELVVFNARIYTMDAARPRAEAFAIEGGRIVAVGSSS